MAVDESSLLPKAPPPRPAGRDAAIAAALRRFDGVEEPAGSPVRPASRWSFGGRPQFGLAVSASLLLAIGLPAALIVLRNNDIAGVPQRETARAPARLEPRAADTDAADVAPPIEAEAPAVAAPTAHPEPNRFRVLADDAPAGALASSPVAALDEVQPAAKAAPAAPPPPAPPPPPAAEMERESAGNSIVVTGTMIGRPNVWVDQQRDGRGKINSAERAEEAVATAPDWVLKDRTYESFLHRLQAAVRTNDRDGVTSLIRFPLRVNFAGGAKIYRDARSVRSDYERIFTPAVKGAILSQRFETLFGRDQGVMIGNGTLWFDHSCTNRACSPPGPVRITAINP